MQADTTFAEGGAEAQDAAIDVQSSALSALKPEGRGRRSKKEAGRKRDDKMPANVFQQIAALANASRVSFYSLLPRGDTGGVAAEFEGNIGLLLTPELQRVRDSNLAEPLQVMTGNTGGLSTVGYDIEDLIEKARTDFSAHYSLGYSPDHLGDGQFHRLRVKVKRRRLDLRYRQGYVDKPLQARLADHVSAALLLGLDENPLGISLEINRPKPTAVEEQWVAPIEIHVPLKEVTLVRQDDVYACDGQLLVAASDAEGRTAPVQAYDLRIEIPPAELDESRAQSYAAKLELRLRQGPQRLAVGFVDSVGQMASFVSRDITVGPGR
jgi:hypothetical protein